MDVKTRGIVLHSVKYAENSLIVSVYTLHHGRCSFMVQGVHGGRSRNKVALFQPLTLLDIEMAHSPRRDLQRFREVSVAMPFHSMHSNIVKSTIALFLGDVLSRVLREEEHNEQLFSYTLHAIQLLDTMTEGVADFHLVFLSDLSKHLGFYPGNNFAAGTPYFDGRAGMFVAQKNSHCLGEGESRLLSLMLDHGFEQAGTLSLNKPTRAKFLEIMIDFYSLHLPGMRHLQSLEVLGQVFD